MIRYELVRAAELFRVSKHPEDGRAAPGHGRRLSAKLQETLLNFSQLRMPRENDLFKIVSDIIFGPADSLAGTLSDTPTRASPNLSLETTYFIL